MFKSWVQLVAGLFVSRGFVPSVVFIKGAPVLKLASSASSFRVIYKSLHTTKNSFFSQLNEFLSTLSTSLITNTMYLTNI
jgi:hypothetical protein